MMSTLDYKFGLCVHFRGIVQNSNTLVCELTLWIEIYIILWPRANALDNTKSFEADCNGSSACMFLV